MSEPTNLKEDEPSVVNPSGRSSLTTDDGCVGFFVVVGIRTILADAFGDDGRCLASVDAAAVTLPWQPVGQVAQTG